MFVGVIYSTCQSKSFSKFTNDYFGNTAATEFNWTYDPNSSSGPKSGEVYQTSNAGNTTFLIVDGATSGNFSVIPVTS